MWAVCFYQAKFLPHILNEKSATQSEQGPIFLLYDKKPWRVFGLSSGLLLAGFWIGLRIFCGDAPAMFVGVLF